MEANHIPEGSPANAPLRPGLYLVGTPLGNLQDISLRALAVLRAADYILAEDTRHTRRLLAHYQINNRLVSCHRFNEQSRAHFTVRQILAGAACALVCNAGMPAVSDPGARLVKACRDAGLYIAVVPGPSAVTAAVALSGFGGGGFVFEGFLPRKSGARQRRLTALSGLDLPVVIFESPYRIFDLLEELSRLLPNRRLCIMRELTKINEECLCGYAHELSAQLKQRFGVQRVKGEIVILIAPATDPAAGAQDCPP